MTGSLVASVKHVLQNWADQGIVMTGASPERVQGVEGDLGLSLPIEMRLLYLHSDGTGDYDDETLRFLPVDEWVWATSFASAGHEAEHAECLIFAEYSIWAHEYALRRRDAAVVLIHGGRPVQVAASFDEFLTTYLSDPRLLFPMIP